MNTPIPRREFLKLTTVVVSVPAVTPCLRAAEAGSAKKRPIRKAVMYGRLGFNGSVLEQFQALKDAGFEGVEPMSHMKQAEVLKALELTGLKAASVCGKVHWDKLLSHPDPSVREAGLEGLKVTLRDAKAYGASSVLLVPGAGKENVSYEDCWKRSIAEIRKAIPVAEEVGVKIAIENVWNNFITKPEQAAAYLEEINSPQVGWHFDIGNVLRYSAPEQWIPVLGKRILKLHVKEFSKVKGFGVKYFEGDNNWPAIMKALDEVGYAGWGITEMPGEQSKDAASLKDLSERFDRILAS